MQHYFEQVSNVYKLNSKFKTVRRNCYSSYPTKELWVQHSLTFATIYTPFTVKDMTLLFKRDYKYHTTLNYKPRKKVLVKQSYVLLMWLGYLAQPIQALNPADTEIEANPTVKTAKTRSSASKALGVPSFFIKPFRNYKTTITRAPMAHKTFSQEQFMVRYYKVNLQFRTRLYKPNNPRKLFSPSIDFSANNKNDVYGQLKDFTNPLYMQALNINMSIYFALKLKVLNPMLSTNMLILHRYRVHFPSGDVAYFTLF